MEIKEADAYKIVMKLSANSQRSPAHNSKASQSNSPSSSTSANPTSTNDLVICIDGAQEASHSNPGLRKLLDTISLNLELDSSKKQLELDEKRIQIAMLNEEKSYKLESNKHELLQKSFELKKKTSELDYTNKLRDLLLESLNNGDFNKCSYLNICLNNQSDPTNLTGNYLANMQLTNRMQGLCGINSTEANFGSSNCGEDELNQVNNMDNFSDETSFIDDKCPNNNTTMNTNLNVPVIQDTTIGNETVTCHNSLDDEDTDYSLDDKQDKLDQTSSKFNGFKNSPTSSSYSLSNRNIRHMICSSHKLEDYSNSAALKILFKGKCTDNDMCKRKEVHTHYLIDTTECRRHISLYFQSSKYGLKFFKTYQIKSQGELEKIVRTFRMKLV